MRISEGKLCIEIRGNEKCLIEGISRLEEYGDNLIAASCEGFSVTVNGSELKMYYLEENRIGISGCIKSVSLGECDVV